MEILLILNLIILLLIFKKVCDIHSSIIANRANTEVKLQRIARKIDNNTNAMKRNISANTKAYKDLECTIGVLFNDPNYTDKTFK